MKSIPVVEHFRADPPFELCKRVGSLVKNLGEERPELTLPEQFRELVPEKLNDAPTLHIDDLSEIPRLDGGQDVRFYQDRARLRAGDNDVVVTCGDLIDGHEDYCRDFLGLGSPQWLRPNPPHVPLRIAEACWEDKNVRQMLIQKILRGDLLYVHPLMGTFSVWEVAFLLRRETGCSIKMIAPPPGVTRWVNNKVAFAATVSRLFGPSFVPRTESAWNFATVAQRVKDLAERSQVIGLKLPNSGGGDGNLVVDAEHFREQPLHGIRETLKDSLGTLAWDGACELLIDSWETKVICSPSAQLWIPPESEGPPLVEGIFVQATEGREGSFVGNAPARFPSALSEEITNRCWLLAWLFQRLGYIGRCSFDMILVGESLKDCRLEFVECNGRWGGTSLPMTLMNRIFGNWCEHPYGAQVFRKIAGLDRMEFKELLRFFHRELFDVRTGQGKLILYNPGRLKYQAGISAIWLGQSWEEAAETVRQDIPERLRQLAAERTKRMTGEVVA